MKKAVLIIAQNMFRDEEYIEPKEILEKAGIKTVTASTNIGPASGKLGMKTHADIKLTDVHPKDYDAVVFIGGPGSYDFYDDPDALRIAKETISENKLLAAICAAPGILAHAGLLKGKKATITPSEVELLKSSGAEFRGKPVEIDGNIITADGPQSAKAWGEAVVGKLEIQ
ncbi:DJ-1/PfpI family protein [Candidatus Saganbacteria bacterium]|nr:DJ-1/PfpI family protein [Candidatus Saganbacteria bacterium]